MRGTQPTMLCCSLNSGRCCPLLLHGALATLILYKDQGTLGVRINYLTNAHSAGLYCAERGRRFLFFKFHYKLSYCCNGKACRVIGQIVALHRFNVYQRSVYNRLAIEKCFSRIAQSRFTVEEKTCFSLKKLVYCSQHILLCRLQINQSKRFIELYFLV